MEDIITRDFTISHDHGNETRFDARLLSSFLDTIRFDPCQCQNECISCDGATPSNQGGFRKTYEVHKKGPKVRKARDVPLQTGHVKGRQY